MKNMILIAAMLSGPMAFAGNFIEDATAAAAAVQILQQVLNQPSSLIAGSSVPQDIDPKGFLADIKTALNDNNPKSTAWIQSITCKREQTTRNRQDLICGVRILEKAQDGESAFTVRASLTQNGILLVATIEDIAG